MITMGVSLPAWLSTEGQALTVAVLACILAWLFVPVLLNCYRTISRRIKLQPVPLAPGCLPFLGHAADLLGHQFPWEVLLGYCNTLQRDVVRWALPWQDWVIIRGGRHMKLVLQTNFKHYDKEMAMSFHPFVCILGTGLVTSHGDLWHKQRRLMTPAFKQEILDHVITISLRAVTRLNSKLDAARSTQSVIEIEEEFRLLTLQVCRARPNWTHLCFYLLGMIVWRRPSLRRVCGVSQQGATYKTRSASVPATSMSPLLAPVGGRTSTSGEAPQLVCFEMRI